MSEDLVRFKIADGPPPAPASAAEPPSWRVIIACALAMIGIAVLFEIAKGWLPV